jgi:hypothetical protein
VFKPGKTALRVASANSFTERPLHQLRGKLQELLLCQAIDKVNAAK